MKRTGMIKKLLFLACMGFFISLTGCTAQKVAPTPAPTTAVDALSDVVVVAVHQCLRTTGQDSAEFKACVSDQLDAAVAQIERFKQCFALKGCKPNSGL